MPSPDLLKEWIDLVVVYGGTLVIFTFIILIVVRLAWAKVDSYIESMNRPNVEKMRKINMEIDSEENEKSTKKIKAIQLYLEENMDAIFGQWVDRVNVWINHNGTRIGDFHFIFYSLIAELVNHGSKSFANSKVSLEKIPYYVFADYENEIMKNGFVFKQSEELCGAASAIARDYGTKTIYWLPVYGIREGKVDGIIFFSSTGKNLVEIPKVSRYAEDVRALLIS